MKISYNWLQEFIDLDLNPEELADKLTLIGLEVEEIEEFGSTLEGVIVGEVLETKPHPNADRLKVCTVNLGEEQVQIVCGADNVAAGQKVPVATVGSTLPIKLDDGSFLTLRKAKLRGEESHGMICAEDELGLGSDHDGIMVLDSSLETGTLISDIFDLYQDTIIEIAITPNRPDATCHLGVARDIAAALDLELVKPAVNNFPFRNEGVSANADGVVEIDGQKIHSNYISNLPYNSDLKERARELRKAGNLPEVLFWNEVKSKKFFGLDFDRQRVIGSYIVDFYVKSLGLVVEIDGSSHDNKQEYDAERQAYLEELGIKVKRFTTDEVKEDISWVLDQLANYVVQEYRTPRPDSHRDTPLKEGNSNPDYSIEVESDKCHRYVAKLVKNVTIEDSPKWLQDKLTAIGLRPVNNVVDITNYVMYELGQPLHAFDFDNLNGGTVIIKEFDKEVEFETLDHIKRTCAPGTLFICDGNGPVAIAGVMGGLHSEVSDSTTNILIESAYFDPGSIRKTSKQQTLQTDASYRFERGIDPNLQAIAAQRTADLIIEVCGGEAEVGITDIHPVKTETHQLTLRKSYVNRLLGTNLSVDEIIQIVNGLELDVVSKNEDTITFEIPTFRPDLEREVDLIEEVGRLFDYNKIGSKNQGIFVSTEPLTDWELLLSKTRDVGVQLGFKEIYSNSLISQNEALNFVSEEQMIETLNPLNKDMSTMRPSLMHGFLKSASYNFNRKAETIRFFEVGNVFSQSEDATYHDGINEQTHLLLGLSGLKNTEHWTGKAIPFSIFDLKSEVNAFFTKLGLAGSIKIEAIDESSLTYSFKKIELGKVSTVSQALLDVYDIEHKTYIAEFSLDKISEALGKHKAKSFTPIPKFPAFEFDFAVIVKQEVSAGDLMNSIKSNAGNTLKNIDIFDVFEGESIGAGNKSIAFRLNFIDPNKTLNIKEVEPIIQRVVKSLEKQFSAKLRS
ncbi:MAG: phenylalanine--tRNA ligase subunit beta [Balneola sp.]